MVFSHLFLGCVRTLNVHIDVVCSPQSQNQELQTQKSRRNSCVAQHSRCALRTPGMNEESGEQPLPSSLPLDTGGPTKHLFQLVKRIQKFTWNSSNFEYQSLISKALAPSLKFSMSLPQSKVEESTKHRLKPPTPGTIETFPPLTYLPQVFCYSYRKLRHWRCIKAY